MNSNKYDVFLVKMDELLLSVYHVLATGYQVSQPVPALHLHAKAVCHTLIYISRNWHSQNNIPRRLPSTLGIFIRSFRYFDAALSRRCDKMHLRVSRF